MARPESEENDLQKIMEDLRDRVNSSDETAQVDMADGGMAVEYEGEGFHAVAGARGAEVREQEFGDMTGLDAEVAKYFSSEVSGVYVE